MLDKPISIWWSFFISFCNEIDWIFKEINYKIIMLDKQISTWLAFYFGILIACFIILLFRFKVESLWVIFKYFNVTFFRLFYNEIDWKKCQVTVSASGQFCKDRALLPNYFLNTLNVLSLGFFTTKLTGNISSNSFRFRYFNVFLYS